MILSKTLFKKPNKPFLLKIVIKTNPIPKKTVHQLTHSITKKPREISGACPPVNHDDNNETLAAPIIAPYNFPLPPMATQTAKYIEAIGAISAGFIIPACG